MAVDPLSSIYEGWGAVSAPIIDQALIEAIRQQVSLPLQPTPDYAAMAFTSPWTSYGSVYAPPGFTRGPTGMVHLRGMALRSSGTPSSQEVICTLPIGFRPEATRAFACAGGDGAGLSTDRVDVTSAGEVRWITGNFAAGAFVSLDNIHFRAAK